MASYGRMNKGRSTKGMTSYQAPPLGPTSRSQKTGKKIQPPTKKQPPGDEGKRRAYRGY